MNKKPRLAIIDADCFLFYAGWHYREQLNILGEGGAKKRVDKMISNILDRLEVDEYIGFFGLDNTITFRHRFATIKPYKGARNSDEWQKFFKPRIKKHYADKWKFIGVKDLEADDAVMIAFNQFKDDYDIVMVGEDKDMKQLGEFTQYNPRTTKTIDYEHLEGRLFFWSQCLHGDGSDNIPGIEGVGSGKKGGRTSKNKVVMGLYELENPTEEDMFNYVQQAYINKYGNRYMYYFLENYILLNMIKYPALDYPKDCQPIKTKKKVLFTPEKLLKL